MSEAPPPLSTNAVLRAMADALPTHQTADDSSDLASSYEVIALLAHAYFASLDFRLCGFSEDKPMPECAALAPRLPPQWNNGFGSLSFVYKHKQSSMSFVLRIDRMGTKVEVRALAVGAENIHRLEYAVRDLVVAKNLPLRITLDSDGNEDRRDLAEKLQKLFASDTVIDKILQDIRVQIVQKLIPKLQKEGYVETEEVREAEANARDERRAQEARGDPTAPFRPAGIPQPYMPYPQPGLIDDNAHRRPPPGDFPPPGFEDEHEINSPPRMMGGLRMPPSNIGHDDLNPRGLGPHDPLRGSFVGGGLPRPGGFSGMHPTFEDPLFTGQGGWGGQPGPGPDPSAYDPQMPPGSRWDPVNPSGGPRFPGRGGQGGGSSGFGFGFGSGDII